MEPNTNETLAELRALFAMSTPHQPMHRMRIAELWERLDAALCSGEELPDDWAHARRRKEVYGHDE